jgi:hypothetical protein
MICREPYKQPGSNDDGCHAIRLSECGHTIGRECFRDWLLRHPDTCPFYNHPLKLLQQHDLSRVERFIETLCKTRFFLDFEDAIILPILADSANVKHQKALLNLHSDRMTLRDAATILSFYGVLAFCLSGFIVACGYLLEIIGVAMYVVIRWLLVRFLPTTPWAFAVCPAYVGHVLALLPVYIGVIAALFLMAPVFGVLSLGWFRSRATRH